MKTKRKIPQLKNPIEQTIDTMNRALENQEYFVALTMALIIPDLCSQIQYPNEEYVSKRYKQWYKEWLGPTKDELEFIDDSPYLSADLVYELRNAVVHSASSDIKYNHVHQTQNQLTKFSILIEKKNDCDIYANHSSITRNNVGTEEREYTLNLRGFCKKMTDVANVFMRKNSNDILLKNVEFEEVVDI